MYAERNLHSQEASGLTLRPEEIAAAAARLDRAEVERRQVRQISIDHPQMTIEDAYAVQSAWVALKLERGRRIIGRKVGLTSVAMQKSSQIDEPDFGVLLDDMYFEDGELLPFERFIVPRVEVELAFVLKAPLEGPSISITDVVRATDYVVPVIEVIDARCHQNDPDSGKPRRVVDTISDNAANAAVIVGGRPVEPDRIDLRQVIAICHHNGIVEETGVSAGVMNNPAWGIAWLANRLARYGEVLKPGEIYLSGSFTRPMPAQKGSIFHIDYGTLGSISCRFG